MRSFYVSWAIAAVILMVFAGLIGQVARRDSIGILIDTRGRFSLTQFQLVLWTILVLSLIAGLFVARVVHGVPAALSFKIPDELLIVMGISVGAMTGSSAIKAAKDASRPDAVAASDEKDRPRFAQMFLLEEGELADKVVDVSKFQNFWITLLVVVAYIVVVVSAVRVASTVEALALPGFTGTLLVLLGVSHAGYLAGKLPNPPGTPKGLTVGRRARRAVPLAAAPAAPAGAPVETYTPRNPS